MVIAREIVSLYSYAVDFGILRELFCEGRLGVDVSFGAGKREFLWYSGHCSWIPDEGDFDGVDGL